MRRSLLPLLPGEGRGEGRAKAATIVLALPILLATASCADPTAEIARRILDQHRTSSRVKPLPAAQVVRLRLDSPDGLASGEAEIAWKGTDFRESVSSAGLTRIRGIQGEKSYYTDEDGVTRVGSEPILRELVTRFYFWKRGYLFEDLQNARARPGPADDATVSVELLPRGGNLLLLRFARSDYRLLAVRSPRFRLDFESRDSFRDSSRPGETVAANVLSLTLPTGRLPDAEVGPWSSRFARPTAEALLGGAPEDVVLPASIGGTPVKLRLDAGRSGPVLLSPDTASKTGATFQRDVFGHDLAGRVPLVIDALSYPGVSVERSASPIPGADAVAGGTLFRETIVELDPASARVRFHDPAVWPIPEGYARALIDDDGNVPRAILGRNSEKIRVVAGAAPGSGLLLAPASAKRLGLEPTATSVAGLGWGPLSLAPVPLGQASGERSVDWGDDGDLGVGILLRYHVFLDMHHRWIYLKPRG